MKTCFPIASALLLFASSSLPVAAQEKVVPIPTAGTIMTWTVGSEQRKALVFAPTDTKVGAKLPLVFAFHWHGGAMQAASKKMHIQTLWNTAIVVYPQGLPTVSPVDPQGKSPGWQKEAGDYGDRDLKFFDAMLATMQQTQSVDDTRIYATGFSNGGGFSYLLWSERGKILAAIGECAGRTWPSEHLTPPRALLAIAGQADTTDPFADQQQSIETAQQADNAPGPAQNCGQYCKLYPSTTQTPVQTFIHPGAHVYPSWAPKRIVEFFKAHPQI